MLPSKNDVIRFCEQEIREHSSKVRMLLELLQAARSMPDVQEEEEQEEQAS